MRSAIALFLVVCTAVLAEGPDEVLLVVNKSSNVSRQVGEYYAQRRAIPSSNVCLIDTTPQETVRRQVYDDAIAGSVERCLQSKRLVEKVLYIVTTLGVPLRIEGSGGQFGDRAAVDSELATLYATIHGTKPRLEGPVRNPFFAQGTAAKFRHPEYPMYLVCRLAAYDLDDVKRMIDRSLAARNRGRVVLDMQSPRDEPGDEWLRDAALRLPAARVVFDQSTEVVYGASNVIGYGSWGSNDAHHKRRFPGFHWLPGAIVTEFVSTDGRTFARPPDSWTTTTWSDRTNWWAGSPQGLSADYLHEGATGAAGHVYEPYLTYTPRPDYLFPAYLKGRNLAESYYLAIPALSWQNIVLGDPLCRLR